MKRLLHRIFRDWSIESIIGLIGTLGAALAVLALAALLGLGAWTVLHADDVPRQTTSQERVDIGDVHWFCIVDRTAGRVDSRSCVLLDPIEGGAAK